MNIEDINILKQLIREYKRKPETQNEFFIGLIEERALENLLRAYEKQQKEIEELKNKLYYKNLKGKIFINEDLIKAKIEEVENGTFDAKIVLQSLLKGNKTMISDEEKEILNNIKEYMQNDIDKGYHKFFYNDLGSDFKCIDCINAIDNVLNLIEKQSKEIEELKNGQIDFWISDGEIEDRIRNKFVSKDKIKAVIEEIKSRKITNEEIKQAIIAVLQSLREGVDIWKDIY